MNARTLTALKGSIEKWEKIVAGTATDRGPLNCPLCQEFIYRQCAGCPVAKATGTPHCYDSPYTEWENYIWYKWADRGWHELARKVHSDDPKTLRLATAELDFLRSLLPEQK